MKVEFKFKYSDRLGFNMGSIHLCGSEVCRLFGVEREPVDLVVSTRKPSGEDYYEATLRERGRIRYYNMTKAESGQCADYSAWDIALDRMVIKALNHADKVYFWMMQ